MWPGGKTRILKHYIPFMPGPSEYSVYCDPFFGGGAMFLYVKSRNPNLKCYLNDINASVIQIFISIQNDLKDFTTLVNELERQYLPLDRDGRYNFHLKIREQYVFDYKKWSKLEDSAHLFFLMKTGFNGILNYNLKNSGRYYTTPGFLRETDGIYNRQLVNAWNKILENCIITAGDWKDCVKQIKQDDVFYFMDPPYRDCQIKYGSTFTDKDQIELLNFCKNADSRGSKVFLCNKETDDFWKNKQGNLQILRFNAAHTAGQKSFTKNEKGVANVIAPEILFHSKKYIATLEEFMS